MRCKFPEKFLTIKYKAGKLAGWRGKFWRMGGPTPVMGSDPTFQPQSNPLKAFLILTRFHTSSGESRKQLGFDARKNCECCLVCQVTKNVMNSDSHLQNCNQCLKSHTSLGLSLSLILFLSLSLSFGQVRSCLLIITL